MPSTDVSDRPPLFSDAVRRRWPLIAAITGFCMLGALAYGQVRHTSYDAETTVIVYPVVGAPFSDQQTGNQLVDLSTEAQLVRSDGVAQLAQQQLAKQGYQNLTAAGLISRVTAVVQTNSQVLQITYSAGAPRRARDGADAFAAAYLQYRETQARQDTDADLKSVADQRAVVERNLTLNQQALANAVPGSKAADLARAQILFDDKTLTDLRAQEADIKKRAVLPGEVLSPATLPSTPHGLSAPILAGFGLLIGLLLGVIAAVARERKVGTIRRAESLPDEPPLLAVVPPVRVAEPVLLSTPEHRSGEAYRLLYLAVDAALPGNPGRGQVIVVSSLTDPAPPVAINLAVAAAAAGRVTTYVDALPRGSAPKLPALGADLTKPGFADAVLRGDDPVAAQSFIAQRLSFLTSGADIARAAESYGGPRTQRVLETLRRAADLVVVAAPSLTEPDGQALANVANATVVVVSIGTATFGQLDTAVTESTRVHAHVLGVVAAHPASGSLPARNRPQRVTPAPAAAGSEQPPEPATWVAT